MINYIDFDFESEASHISRIGGGASLPADFTWPKDKDENPMLHLLTLSSDTINSYSDCSIPEGFCLSVFIPYKRDSIEHVIELARNPASATLIVHQIGDKIRNEFPYPLSPAHAITVDTDEDAEDEDEFSDEIDNKIGGLPVWLQDRLEVPERSFLLQLLGSMFDKYWPTHKGIFIGGVVYIFINSKIEASTSAAGQLTVQYT